MTTSPSLPSINSHISTQTPIFLLSNTSNYVTIKLDHSNYLMWKFQIIRILDVYSLLDHLEDPTPCPSKFLLSKPETETQEVNPPYTQWRARDKALFSLISSTLTFSNIFSNGANISFWNLENTCEQVYICFKIQHCQSQTGTQ